jgi:hypothetical protein
MGTYCWKKRRQFSLSMCISQCVFIDYETVYDIAHSYKRITNIYNKTQYKVNASFQDKFRRRMRVQSIGNLKMATLCYTQDVIKLNIP